mmetsp:Transcript_10632/g.13205  ORF Transcript_10632/g.13205 Transcript_10632/m.13205 type:complete len:214 (+) Transcript_10632:235-876(+)
MALGNHRDALLNQPPQRHLRARFVVVLSDGRDQLPCQELLVVWRIAGSTQRREGLVENAFFLHVAFVIGRQASCSAHADMVLDLVHSHRNTCDLQDIIQLTSAIMRDANGARLATLGPGFKGLPLGLPLLSGTVLSEICWEMNQHQIHIVHVELFQASVRRSFGGGGVETSGDLRSNEETLPRQLQIRQGLANALLIRIGGSCIHMPVAQAKG